MSFQNTLRGVLSDFGAWWLLSRTLPSKIAQKGSEFVLGAQALWVDPVYTLGIEFVAGSFTEVTTRVERASWGSYIVDILRPPSPGQALFELSNDDGQMTPKNNTNLVPGKAVRLTATHGSSLYPLFFGRILEVSPSPILGQRTTLIEARDDWDRVSRLQYNTRLLVDTKPNTVFTQLMSESMVQSFGIPDSITDTLGFVWYQDRDALNALHQLAQSGHYQILLDGNGTYRLRGRFWSFFSTPVASYDIADNIRYRLAQDSVINRTKITAQPRRQTSDVTTLAFLDQTIAIHSGQTFGFWAVFQDPNEPSEVTPVGSVISLVSSQDYYAAPNEDGSGNPVTSQLSLDVTAFAASAVTSIYNNGPGTVYLTRFQIRGYPIQRLPVISGQYDVVSSQTTHGLRLFTVEDSLIQNLSFNEQLSKVITAERHRGKNENKYTLSQEFPDVLRNTIGDVIHLTDLFSGYSLEWQIRGAEHEIDLTKGLRHSVTYELETHDNFPFLVLDHATFGKLDAGRVLAV